MKPTISFRIDPQQLAILETVAKIRNTTKTRLIQTALLEFLSVTLEKNIE